MTLCPHCGGHEVETLGDGSRESAPQTAPEQPAAGEDAA